MKNKLFLSVVMLLTSLGLFAQTPVYNVMDYGAKGDGITDDAIAIQRAIDACSAKGGGQVYLPCGKTFLAGPIELKSNINLYLDAGSVLKAHPDESIYKMSAFKDNRGEGMMWLHCKD
ncbi:MAG: glycoside hydrolase family 28 protein, partial [Prevotella sp.]|nr:glycoside hydrolase family 28 protein [Prevotella sp.]